MNNAMSLQKRQKTGKLTQTILFISFVILLGRLIYVVPGAIEHHQQKKIVAETEISEVSVQNEQ